MPTSMSDKIFLRIQKAALKSHGLIPPNAPASGIFWDEHFFEVAGTGLYQMFTHEQRQDFLTQMSSDILAEACSIETAGLTYAAKMNLSSRNTDEKIMYSLIGTEEALHLKSLEPFLAVDVNLDIPSFAGLIHHWIDKLDRPSLLVMIQILLEGWGLAYYQSLAQNCRNPQLQSVFQQILLDETRHHATGVILYRHEILKAPERQNLEQELATLFSCVQSGPQQVLLALATTSGDRNIDFAKLLTEMDAVNQCQAKLNKLRRLLEKTGDPRMISAALAKDLFQAYPLDQMALYAQSEYEQTLRNLQPSRASKLDISL